MFYTNNCLIANACDRIKFKTSVNNAIKLGTFIIS